MDKDPALVKGEDLLVKGEYIKATVTIEKAEVVKRKNESGTKEGLLLYFKSGKKPFFAPFDQVNYRLIRSECGTTEPSELIGKRITLIPVVGNWFGGENELALRVLVSADKPKPKISKSAFGKPVVGLKVTS